MYALCSRCMFRCTYEYIYIDTYHTLYVVKRQYMHTFLVHPYISVHSFICKDRCIYSDFVSRVSRASTKVQEIAAFKHYFEAASLTRSQEGNQVTDRRTSTQMWCNSDECLGRGLMVLPWIGNLMIIQLSLVGMDLPKGRGAQPGALPALRCKGVGRHRALVKIPCNSRGNSSSRPWSRPWSRPKRRLRLLRL